MPLRSHLCLLSVWNPGAWKFQTKGQNKDPSGKFQFLVKSTLHWEITKVAILSVMFFTDFTSIWLYIMMFSFKSQTSFVIISGRRSNGFLFGDEKVLYPMHNYESLEDSPLSEASLRVFSQLDSGIKGYFRDGFGQHHHQKLRRSEPKKICTFLSPNESQMTTSYSQRLIDKRNGIHQQSMAFSEWPSMHHYFSDGLQRHGFEQLDNPDINEFRYRDAASAARHALKMAKFKRERAQRLLFRADLAIHKAVVALTTAEAIKASSDNLNGDG